MFGIACKSAKTPAQKAADTRRAGLIFLLVSLPMCLAVVVGYLLTGGSETTLTTMAMVITYAATGAGMYYTGRRDLARLHA